MNEIQNVITCHNSEIRVNTFTFVDINNRDSLSCETRISVYEEIECNQSYLRIQLDSKYSDGRPINNYSDVNEHRSHPMISFKHTNFVSYFRGFSVIKNEMTEKIVDFILKEDYELAEHTGSITPKTYRRSLLHSLVLLSD
jgi:hypothetical protein